MSAIPHRSPAETEGWPIPWQAAGVVATARSPSAALRSLPVRAVELGDGFWRPRLATNVAVTLPRQLALLHETGTLRNFQLVYGAAEGERVGPVYTDSDLYKWIEAASWALQSSPTPHTPEVQTLARSIEAVIDIIAPAQGADGYLNTYFQGERAHLRWTNLERDHELYCAGHLIQAAVAHHRATGQTRLLEIATRFADYIADEFGWGKREGHPGHPELEMALVELYRETGARRYLDLAGFFIDHAGGSQMREILGHAVRALYFCCGMTDYYAETGNPAYREALQSLWRSMTETKMYITGAAGGRWRGESFGRAFELPHENAYAETCANIASFMWNWRLLALAGESRFADLMELTLYNSVLSGISLDGEAYFYVNPHASNGQPTDDPWYPQERRPAPQRQRWFGTACCPPNIARTFAALPGYFYSTTDAGLWVHLYDHNTLRWRLPDGTPLTVSQSTRYPWDGRVDITVSPARECEFSLFLRIPGWCHTAALSVEDGGIVRPPKPGRYYELRRAWRPNTRLTLGFSMPSVWMVANPMAAETRCSVALRRGPLVYCFEAADNPGFSVRQARVRVDPLRPFGSFTAEHRPDLLGGVTVLRGRGVVPTEPWGPLYRPLAAQPIPTRPVELVGIPYYAWANRSPGEMTIWLQAN